MEVPQNRINVILNEDTGNYELRFLDDGPGINLSQPFKVLEETLLEAGFDRNEAERVADKACSVVVKEAGMRYVSQYIG